MSGIMISENTGQFSIYRFQDVKTLEYTRYIAVARDITEARTKIRAVFGDAQGDRVDRCPVSIFSLDAVIDTYGYDSFLGVTEPDARTTRVGKR